MDRMEVLREIFDEKIIIILNIFLDNPGRQFSLTQVSSLSRINIATAMRIIDKLVKKDIVELVNVGKSKFYRLKSGEKTLFLNRLLKREDQLNEFIEKIKNNPRISKVILEGKTNKGAKLLIIGNFLPTEKLHSLVEEIRKKSDFRIQFVEISEKQFSDMEKIGLYDLNKKIIWERRKH